MSVISENWHHCNIALCRANIFQLKTFLHFFTAILENKSLLKFTSYPEQALKKNTNFLGYVEFHWLKLLFSSFVTLLWANILLHTINQWLKDFRPHAMTLEGRALVVKYRHVINFLHFIQLVTFTHFGLRKGMRILKHKNKFLSRTKRLEWHRSTVLREQF